MSIGIVDEAVIEPEPIVVARTFHGVAGGTQSVGPSIHIVGDEGDDHPARLCNAMVTDPYVGIFSDPIDEACTLIPNEFEVEDMAIEGL